MLIVDNDVHAAWPAQLYTYHAGQLKVVHAGQLKFVHIADVDQIMQPCSFLLTCPLRVGINIICEANERNRLHFMVW